jgi:hypothetical protein
MKKFYVTCWILLAVVFSAPAQDHPPNTKARPGPPATVGSWVRLNSEEGGFSVLLPELVKDQSETNISAKGPYTTHLFVAKTTKGVFIVGWVDYDPSFNFSVQSELEANRDNFVKGVKGTLLNTTRIVLNGNPGLEFTAETPQTMYRSRVYVIGRRPYQLITSTYKGQDNADNVARFFESFAVR